jgi:hypothetical protein
MILRNLKKEIALFGSFTQKKDKKKLLSFLINFIVIITPKRFKIFKCILQPIISMLYFITRSKTQCW